MSLETPEPPQEIWLVYDWHGPWWEVYDRSRDAPDGAVRYVRPPITAPELQAPAGEDLMGKERCVATVAGIAGLGMFAASFIFRGQPLLSEACVVAGGSLVILALSFVWPTRI